MATRVKRVHDEAPRTALSLGRQPAGFEVLRGRLMVFRPRALNSLDDVAQVVHVFDAFLAHVPRVVSAGLIQTANTQPFQ